MEREEHTSTAVTLRYPSSGVDISPAPNSTPEVQVPSSGEVMKRAVDPTVPGVSSDECPPGSEGRVSETPVPSVASSSFYGSDVDLVALVQLGNPDSPQN